MNNGKETVKFLAIFDHHPACPMSQHPAISRSRFIFEISNLKSVMLPSHDSDLDNFVPSPLPLFPPVTFPPSLTSQFPLRTLLPLMADANTTKPSVVLLTKGGELMEKIVS